MPRFDIIEAVGERWEADPEIINRELRIFRLTAELKACVAELRRIVLDPGPDRLGVCCMSSGSYERARRVIENAEHELRHAPRTALSRPA